MKFHHEFTNGFLLLTIACVAVSVLGNHLFAQEKKQKPKKPAPFKWVNPLSEADQKLNGLKHETFESPSLQSPVGYCIYLPSDYDSIGNKESRYPVVYYLHGGRPGNERKSIKLVANIDQHVSAKQVAPMIYVFVNGGPVSHYNMPGQPYAQGADVFVKELIPHIDATYRTIASREGRGLEGFSQGGRGTARLMFRYPDLFCSAAPGGGGHATEKKISENGGAESEVLKFAKGDNTWDLARAYATDLKKNGAKQKLRILVHVGDEGFNYENNLQWMEYLHSLGIEYEKIIVPGVGHNARGIYDKHGLDIMKFHARNFQLASPNAQLQQDIDTAQLHYQQESWDEAEKAFARLVHSNPKNGEYLFKLAKSCAELEKYETSNTYYLACLKTGYKKGQTVYGITANYSVLRNKKDALKWLLIGLGVPKSITYQDVMTDRDFEFIRTSPEYAKIIPRLSDEQSRDDRWKTDIHFAKHAMETIHYDVFRKTSKSRWNRDFKDIQDHLDQLTDSEIIMKLTRIVASVGDGHTFVRPPTSGDLSFHFFPLQIYQFKEGVFVISADKTNESLVGQKLVEISGVKISEVLKRLAPLLSVDNEMGLKENVKLVLFAEFLNAIGVLDGTKSSPMTFEDKSGKRTTTTLHSGPFDPKLLTSTMLKSNETSPLYLSHPNEFFWSKHLKKLDAIYLQININYSPPGKSLTEFYADLFKQIEQDDIGNLIIDIRNCPGGNSFLNKVLIKHILQSKKINKQGSLYTLIGRRTFSAAMNLATDLET